MASPTLCSLIHQAVTRAPDAIVPLGLQLKHHFDYTPVWIEPTAIRFALPVGNWRRGRSAAAGPGRFAEARQWWTHGGGWKSADRHISRNFHGRFILGGNWDINKRDFEVLEVIISIAAGDAVEKTSEYEKILKWVEAGDFRFTKGCLTPRDVDRYFSDMVSSFQSIRDHGYRTQEELGSRFHGDEVRICLDRQGQIVLFGGGRHRLSIALILELPRIPVLVKRVHADWVEHHLRRSGGDLPRAVDSAITESLHTGGLVGCQAEDRTPTRNVI